MNLSDLWHKITPYLTGGDSAVGAVFGNHPYPARTLLITLGVLWAVLWVAWRAVLKPFFTK